MAICHDGQIHIDRNGCKNATGDPTLRWEVARGWRLGRRAFCKLCEAEDPFEVKLDQEFRRGRQILSQALVFLVPSRSSVW